jgi:transposase-like protein
VSDAIAPHGGTVRTFVMDEARLGQQGTLTRVWARTGSRPTAVKQTKYEWVYLYAAVEPATGESVALLAPNVDAGTFNVFLRMLARELRPGEHAVLILDGAGWHKAKRVAIPDNVTCLLLPPYRPELNPVENLWHYLRSHYLEQPRLRRLRRPARRRRRRLAQTNARRHQVRLPMPLS